MIILTVILLTTFSIVALCLYLANCSIRFALWRKRVNTLKALAWLEVREARLDKKFPHAFYQNPAWHLADQKNREYEERVREWEKTLSKLDKGLAKKEAKVAFKKALKSKKLESQNGELSLSED